MLGNKSLGIRHVFNLRDEHSCGRVLLLSGTLAGAVANQITTGIFLSGFLLNAGMSAAELGLLGSLSSVLCFSALLSPILFKRVTKRKYILCSLDIASQFIAVFATTLVPRFPVSHSIQFLLIAVFFAFGNGLRTLISPGYSAWHYQFIKSSETRTIFIIVQQILMGGVAAVTLLVSGMFSDYATRSGDPTVFFTRLRFAAFAIIIVETILFLLIKEYPYPEDDRKSASILSNLKNDPAVRKFAATIFIVFIWTFSTNFSAFAFDAYMINEIQAPYLLITVFTASSFVFMLLFSGIWRYVIRRISWFRTLGIGAFLYAPFCVVLGLVSAGNYHWLFPVVRVCQLFINVGVIISVNNMPYINMPKKGWVSGFSMYMFVLGIASFAGQLSGASIVSAGKSLNFRLFGNSYGIVTVLMVFQGVLFLLLSLYSILLRNRLEPSPDAAGNGVVNRA